MHAKNIGKKRELLRRIFNISDKKFHDDYIILNLIGPGARLFLATEISLKITLNVSFVLKMYKFLS